MNESCAIADLPNNEFVELGDGTRYYVPGTRIGLLSIIEAHRDGETAEELLESWPGIGSLEKARGIVRFIDEYPEAIEAYLAFQQAAFEKSKQEHPIPEHLLEKRRRTRKEIEREELERRSA